MTEAKRMRVVFDTNTITAALKSHNPGSPNVELLGRWEAGQFELPIYPRTAGLAGIEFRLA